MDGEAVVGTNFATLFSRYLHETLGQRSSSSVLDGPVLNSVKL